MIDYQISYHAGSDAYTVLASGLTTTSYTASSLVTDTVYTFKITARNLVGNSAYSSEFAVRAASRPNTPSAPTTSVISNTSVVITWAAMNNGGSPITSYTITIRQIDGVTYTTELGNCNGSSPSVVSALSCTIPIATLTSSPFNLPWGSSVYAKVVATNIVNSSDVSNEGNGGIILTNPAAPVSLANNPLVTSASVIGLTWSAGATTGGTPVIDYRISWD